MEEQEPELDLRALLATLRRRGWIIIACVVAFAVIAFLWSSRSADKYAAVAQVRITDPNAESVFNGAQIKSDPKREVDTQILVVQSSEIRQCADGKLGPRAPEVDNLVVTGQGETDILLIRAESRSPEVARDAANAVADCYVDAKREALVSEFQQRAIELRRKATGLSEQMAALDLSIAATSGPEAAALQAQKTGLQTQKQELDRRADESEIEAAVRSGNVELVDHAALPTAPFTPKPLRDAALAATLGLLVGLSLVFLLERITDTVNVEEVDRLVGGVPLLGAIPLRAGGKLKHHRLPDLPHALVELRSVDAEAFRTLTTSLRFSNLGREKRIIAVTSASVGEGKSTLTANLAVSLAQSGQRVVALSADLRRPSLSEFFGLDDSGEGLTSVLVGDTSLSQALRRLPGLDTGRLEVLPAGPSPHNPAELLGSDHMNELLQSLVSSGADYVLVDCPPVLPVSDTLALVQHVDGVIVVCVPGQTKADNLTTALHRLEQVGSEIIGVVLNGVSATKGRYGHYYRYEYAPANADAPRRTRNGTSAGTSAGTNGSSTPEPFARGAEAIVADEAAKNG